MNKFNSLKRDILYYCATKYVKYLYSIDFNNPIDVRAEREWINKNLSAYYMVGWWNINKKLHKHLNADYFSTKALNKLKVGDTTKLIYEHVIPQNYIIKQAKDLRKRNELTVDILFDMLVKHWYIAVVTKEENSLLTRTKIPDVNDNFSRYKVAGLYEELNENEIIHTMI